MKKKPQFLDVDFAKNNYESFAIWLDGYYSPFAKENMLFSKISSQYGFLPTFSVLNDRLNQIFSIIPDEQTINIYISDIDAVCSSRSASAEYRNYRVYKNFIKFGDYCYHHHLQHNGIIGEISTDEALLNYFHKKTSNPDKIRQQEWCGRNILMNSDGSHRHAASAYLASINREEFCEKYEANCEKEVFNENHLENFLRLGKFFTLVATPQNHKMIQSSLNSYSVPYTYFQILPQREKEREEEKECFVYFFAHQETLDNELSIIDKAKLYAYKNDLRMVVDGFNELVDLQLCENFGDTVKNIISGFSKTS